jgi:pimeloyl-ACP methyl ester carboxylesterase
MRELVAKGIIGVAIDGRYHGERNPAGKGTQAYNEAIARAWKSKSNTPREYPFYYDTCWDLWRTLDYLTTRDDIDADRIGMIGFSKGGIETWLSAAVDERVKVAVPAIAVQSFRWSLENDKWQGRANTIKLAHDAAAKDLGESMVNQRVCRELWSKVIPGILNEFDCPSMLRLFAGRPMLILSGEKDGNCPVEGARIAITVAKEAYKAAKVEDKLQVILLPEVGHSVTKEQRQASIEWFEKWLKR